MMPALIALGQVLLIDLVLAGDNAVVVGMAVAGLPAEQKNRAILIGIGAATLFRIGFALITVQLLAIVGLLLVASVILPSVLAWTSSRLPRKAATPPESSPTPNAASAGV